MRVSKSQSMLDDGAWRPALPVHDDGPSTLVMVFGASEHPGLGAALDGVVARYPRSVVVGCSSAGEIHGTSVCDGSLSVSVARFEHSRLRSATVTVEEGTSQTLGRLLGARLAGPELVGVFVLSDGLAVNGSELVKGLVAALPEGVVVTGGLSGDGTRFGSTWVLADGAARSGIVTAVGLYGRRLRVRHGSQGGWDAFGPERTVTRSEANVVYEIDGRPALDLYKQYLGDKAAELPSSGLLFPLALRDPARPERVLVRTLLAVDEEARSLTFAGDLPRGHLVQLMKADFERLVGGAGEAAESMGAVDDDRLVVAISCVGRRLVLGERIEEEVEAVRAELGTDAIVGFYSYGELSPVGQGSCELHNQTMTLTTFHEVDEAAVAQPGPVGGMELARLAWDAKRDQWDAPLPTHLDGPRTLVTVFGDPRVASRPAPIERLRRAFPQAHVVGCSSSGEIHGSEVRDHSLTISVMRFARTSLRSAGEAVEGGTSREVGARLARRLAGPDLRAVFLCSDGLQVNGSELVAGLTEGLGDDVVITGGLAGDGTDFAATWVTDGDTVGPGRVVAVALYGDHLVVGHGSLGGWDAFGSVRTVTRATDNVLYELDGQPALELYKRYLGAKAAELPASGLLFPLAVTTADDPDQALVRTLLAVDEAEQSMTFAGDVPVGASVQLMKADFGRLVEGARGAGLAAGFDPTLLEGSDAVAIAVSCVGRRLVLGESIEEEVEAVREALPHVAHVTGFYSYGELSPTRAGEPCRLHNQTMTLTTLAESAQPIAREAKGLRVETVGAGEAWPTHLDGPSTLVLAFGDAALRDDPAPLQRLVAGFPRSIVVGCSTAGEILGSRVSDAGLSIAVARFAHTGLRQARATLSDASESYGAGQRLARELAAADLRAVFVLSDGLAVNGSELVRAMNAELPDEVVVTGGLAGDGARFEATWVLVDGAIRSGEVVAVGLYGDHLEVRHGSKGGWDRFGPERTVTRSEGNVLFELDGRPALDLYKQYLGDQAAQLPSSGLRFPLALLDPADPERFLVRTLLAVDEEARSMTFAGDLPSGRRVQLMKADYLRLVEGAEHAARDAMGEQPPALTVAVSCVGRKLVLGDRTEEEVEAVCAALGIQHLVGFYSYGELSPVAGGACELHNQTMTLTTFVEHATPRSRAAEAPPPTVFRGAEATVVDLGDAPLPEMDFEAERTEAVAPDRFAPKAEPEPLGFDDLGVDFAFDAVGGTGAGVDGFDDAPALPAPEEAVDPDDATTTMPPLRDRPTLLRQHGAPTELRQDVRRLQDVTVVALSGKLSEGFAGAELGRRLVGDVVFDLHGLERVTSFGVRSWLNMMQAMDADRLWFARCSEAVVNQMTMIRSFTGHGQVVSFFAPYACSGCGREFGALYDAVADRAAIDANEPVAVRCPSCGVAAAFDDDPWSYFGIGQQLATEVPEALQQVLARLAPLADAGEPIEKEFDGDRTVVHLRARVDGSLRLRRAFDGLEGMVTLDLTAVPAATDEGATAFVRALQRLDDGVVEARVEGAPEVLVRALAKEGVPPRVRVVSAMVTAACADGGTRRAVLIELADHEAALRAGAPLDLPCDWCSSTLTVDGVRDDLLACLDAVRPSVGATEILPAVDGPAPDPVAAPATPAAPAAPAPSLGGERIPLAGLGFAAALTVGGGLVAAVAVGAVMLALSQGEGAVAVEPLPASAVAAAAVAPPAPVAPAPVLGWEGGAALPPPWSERAFVVADDEVLVVGGAEGDDAVTALEAARVAAVSQLVAELEVALRGTASFDLLQRHDLSEPSPAEVAEAFARGAGPEVVPERVQAAVRQDADGVYVVAQYRLDRAAWDQVVATYRATAGFRGITVARVFPTLAAAVPGGELVVVDVARWIRDANVGDRVVAVDGRGVFDPEAFDAATDAAWARLGEREALHLTVQANGLERDVRFVKPSRER